PQEADFEEPHADRDRGSGSGAGDRAAGLGPGAGVGSAKAPRAVDLAGGRALRVAAPRSGLDETGLGSGRGQGGAGWHPVDRSPDRRAREGQVRQGGAWRVRERVPGYCGAQDTFYVGTLKGVGRIYQQTFIDTYAKVAFAKLYDRKTPITAAE